MAQAGCDESMCTERGGGSELGDVSEMIDSRFS